jgi:hypothetical protein
MMRRGVRQNCVQTPALLCKSHASDWCLIGGPNEASAAVFPYSASTCQMFGSARDRQSSVYIRLLKYTASFAFLLCRVVPVSVGFCGEMLSPVLGDIDAAAEPNLFEAAHIVEQLDQPGAAPRSAD